MTIQELNKAVKKLYSTHYTMSFKSNDEYYEYIEKEFKPEFKRLYFADDTLQALTKDNILKLLVLNRKHRVIDFHRFGINIKF